MNDLVGFIDNLKGGHIQSMSVPKGSIKKYAPAMCDCHCECDCLDIDCQCDCHCDCECSSDCGI